MKLWHARYAVRQTDGVAVRQDDFYLPSAADVSRAIASRGWYPISIRAHRPPAIEWFDIRTSQWQIQFLRALRYLTNTRSAGEALKRVIDSEDDPRRQTALLPARNVLQGGGTFGDAIAAIGLFDKPTLAILMAGEQSSQMGAVIEHAMRHIEERIRRTRSMRAAVGWLAFDIVSIFSSIFYSQWSYIPYLRNEGIQSPDPAVIERFRHNVDIAAAINGALTVVAILVLAAGSGVALLWMADRQRARNAVAVLARPLPFFGAFFQHTVLADTAQTLSRLLRGGVRLDRGLRIVSDASLSADVKRYWSGVLASILGGALPQRAVARAPLRPMEQQQMGSFQTLEQFGEILEALAAERNHLAAAERRKIAVLGVVFLVFAFATVVGLMLWLVWLQNEGLLATMDSIRAH